MPYRTKFLRSQIPNEVRYLPLVFCSRSDSYVIENNVPILKISSGEVTEDIKEYSEEKEICLIWSNFEFAFGEKLACLDIFYRVINVYWLALNKD